jgi:hypothetical protein
MTLFYLPFGKFFHIVQRPASVGVELYRQREREAPQAVCPRCGTEFVGQMWLDDLKEVVGQLGFDYSMGDGRTLQDFCPRCKRIMRGLSYAALPRRDAEVFRGSRAEGEQSSPLAVAAHSPDTLLSTREGRHVGSHARARFLHGRRRDSRCSGAGW